MEKPQNSSRFFENRACGGDYTYNERGIKDCSDCTFPHRPENYDRLLARYGDILKVVRREDQEGV